MKCIVIYFVISGWKGASEHGHSSEHGDKSMKTEDIRARNTTKTESEATQHIINLCVECLTVKMAEMLFFFRHTLDAFIT